MFRASRAVYTILRAGPETTVTPVANKLICNFLTPTDVIMTKPVDEVYIQTSNGVAGLSPQHSKMVAQLAPGLMTIIDNKVETHYYVAGGFAFCDGIKIDVQAVEAVKVEDLDKAIATSSLEEYRAKYAAAVTPEDKAIAEIGVELYSSMLWSISKL